MKRSGITIVRHDESCFCAFLPEVDACVGPYLWLWSPFYMQDQVIKAVDTWLKSGMKSGQLQEIVRERSVKLSTGTRRVLYCKTFGGFGFSEEFRHVRGMTEYSNIETERSSEKAFHTIDLLGQSICTSFPYVCQHVQLCQRLNFQELGEHIHTQRIRESIANKDRNAQADLDQCLEKMQSWPADVLQAAQAYCDTEGARHWSLFISGGGPHKYSADCTFSEHIRLKKNAWPLHEAFRVSGIAGGCLIASYLCEKLQVITDAPIASKLASESPQLILGLAAASDVYCALGYANVPELADYTIYDYDGKETVVW